MRYPRISLNETIWNVPGVFSSQDSTFVEKSLLSKCRKQSQRRNDQQAKENQSVCGTRKVPDYSELWFSQGPIDWDLLLIGICNTRIITLMFQVVARNTRGAPCRGNFAQ